MWHGERFLIPETGARARLRYVVPLLFRSRIREFSEYQIEVTELVTKLDETECDLDSR